MSTVRTVAIAADHGGFALKQVLAAEIAHLGFKPLDLGPETEESVDYPDYALKVVEAVRQHRAECGVLICGTGIGMSMAANRHRQIRAALVHDAYTARMCRQHNDANVLVLGGRVIGTEVAKECLATFLKTAFEGARHVKRLSKFSE
ncbi:MAG: ribose 5-phosphate isomerase B [Alphaproteobacteria bacterium]|nr:ribose 5-phosphate isomerase B [Alphaproteobacteria bacterium]